MKELRFRVWDKEEKLMRHDLFSITYDGIPITYSGAPCNKLELMQYTGLKDKNGTPIFESDIVDFEGHIAEMLYIPERAGFHVTYRDGNDFWTENIAEGDKIRVIGNIWEHPNLLGK